MCCFQSVVFRVLFSECCLQSVVFKVRRQNIADNYKTTERVTHCGAASTHVSPVVVRADFVSLISVSTAA